MATFERRLVQPTTLVLLEVLREAVDARETLTAIALSPDEEWLATGNADGLVKLWPWRRLMEA